jgi:hypothetical protein
MGLIKGTAWFQLFSENAITSKKTSMNIQSLFNAKDPIWEVLIRLAFHLVVLFFVIRLIYNRYSDKKGYLFSFFLMGVVIFLVCVVLRGVDMHIGMAFGIFALFSIVRYRTRNIPIKEMSYFFTILGLSAINALIEFPHPIRGAVLLNAIVILTLYILEISFKKENKKPAKKDTGDDSLNQVMVQYNNLELLDPKRIDELIKDVSGKTRINAEQIRIKSIDLILNKAELLVIYKGLHTKNAEFSMNDSI